LDPNPTVKLFDTEGEAVDWVHEEVKQRVQHIVDHSQYEITEEDLLGIEETEYSLVQIKEV
jgi:hypothetical protein